MDLEDFLCSLEGRAFLIFPEWAGVDILQGVL
jgi:hypothetical protein